MLDLIYLMAMLSTFNVSDQYYHLDTVLYTDLYIESETIHTPYYWARNQKDYLKDSKGDCTDKALLKCHVLRKKGIPCSTVWGYAMKDNISYGHAWYLYKINGTWQSSEPNLTVRGNLLY
jgi:transglutaminase/protease-like cytokinesis protein 3